MLHLALDSHSLFAGRPTLLFFFDDLCKIHVRLAQFALTNPQVILLHLFVLHLHYFVYLRPPQLPDYLRNFVAIPLIVDLMTILSLFPNDQHHQSKRN
jgi:hypothetical protein